MIQLFNLSCQSAIVLPVIQGWGGKRSEKSPPEVLGVRLETPACWTGIVVAVGVGVAVGPGVEVGVGIGVGVGHSKSRSRSKVRIGSRSRSRNKISICRSRKRISNPCRSRKINSSRSSSMSRGRMRRTHLAQYRLYREVLPLCRPPAQWRASLQPAQGMSHTVIGRH